MAQAAPPPRDGARAAEPDGHLAVARAGSAESRRSRTDDGRTHTGADMDDLTERQAATRRELVQALRDDILGPAGGPEEVLTGSERPLTRYLVGPRSEEHTSELQSRENLVCRLLLEKKKRPA